MAARSADNSSKPRPEAGRLRALAAGTLAAVLDGASLNAVLPPAQAGLESVPDRALLQSLCYGVLRDLRLLEALLAQLLDRPTDDRRLHALLLTGLHQLRSLRIPAHAAVSETVAATAHLGLSRARGLANAVLRRYQRERDAQESALPEDPAIRHSHPDWLVARLCADWPQRWREILAANQSPGPMSLRVNTRHGARDDYLARLREAGMPAEPSPHAPCAVNLSEALPVTRLPGFTDGWVSVQDAAAQQAAPLLESENGMRVLDACAAPGGKSAHILETADVTLLALDRDPRRLQRVRETLARLRLAADCCVADAGVPRDWWDGRSFDRILLDAPCSGTGVIRRHPDIKWLRRETDIAAMTATQLRLLTALWPLLAPQGLLLYATCSLLRAEGEDVMVEFLRATPAAQAVPIEACWGESCGVGRRIASGDDGMDGFYYARLRRSA